MYFWAEKMVAQQKKEIKEAVNKQAADETAGQLAALATSGTTSGVILSGGKRLSLRHDSETAAAVIARKRAVAEAAGVPMSGTGVLINICRALLARVLFVVHSMLAIWAAVNIKVDNSIWTFALASVSIVVEGVYTIVMRAGDERKGFSPAIALYILATAAPIWIIETRLCELRRDDSTFETEYPYHLLLQPMLVIIIVGRWLMPKGDLCDRQLSHNLFVYIAVSSDIVQFFDVFHLPAVYSRPALQRTILVVGAASLIQFPILRGVSQARKVRVALDAEARPTKRRGRPDISQVIYNIDIWTSTAASFSQDVPFFFVRFYLLIFHRVCSYTSIFFLCKNAMMIALHICLLQARFGRPSAGELLLEHRRSSRSGPPTSGTTSSSASRSAKRRSTVVSGAVGKQHRHSINSDEGGDLAQPHASSRRASAAASRTSIIMHPTTTTNNKTDSPSLERRSSPPPMLSTIAVRTRQSLDDLID